MSRPVFLLCLVVAVSCLMSCEAEERHPKTGYTGYRASDDMIMEKIIDELNRQGIPYYTYKYNDMLFVAYEVAYKEQFSLIKARYVLGVPEGYSGMCFGSEHRRNQVKDVIEKEAIAYVEQDARGNYCIYWPVASEDAVRRIAKRNNWIFPFAE